MNKISNNKKNLMVVHYFLCVPLFPFLWIGWHGKCAFEHIIVGVYDVFSTKNACKTDQWHLHDERNKALRCNKLKNYSVIIFFSLLLALRLFRATEIGSSKLARSCLQYLDECFNVTFHGLVCHVNYDFPLYGLSSTALNCIHSVEKLKFMCPRFSSKKRRNAARWAFALF